MNLRELKNLIRENKIVSSLLIFVGEEPFINQEYVHAISKINNKEVKIVENQINNATKSKPTVAENQIYAENTTIDENTVSLIYSRAVNIVKAKIDSAKEMIRTISKIISKRQSDEQLSGISGGVN